MNVRQAFSHGHYRTEVVVYTWNNQSKILGNSSMYNMDIKPLNGQRMC